jgi:hypothetical protein
MSLARSTASSSSSLQQDFNNALQAYERQTKINLLEHPLVAQLQSCNSPSAIISLLREQVQGPGRSQDSDDKLTKWLDPTVIVVGALSTALGAQVSLVCLEMLIVMGPMSYIKFAGCLTGDSSFYRGRLSPFSARSSLIPSCGQL